MKTLNRSKADMLVIDGNYLGYKAYFAMSDMIHDGDVTGVLLGFAMGVLRLSQQFKTNNIVFVWDSKHNFRKDAYPEYKNNRTKARAKESDEDKQNRKAAYEMFALLRKTILPAIGFKTNLMQRGLEGDDMMEMVVKQQHETNYQGHTVIVTSDADLLQSIYPHVSMWIPDKMELITEQGVFDKYGVTPKEWKEVKALGGCSSDNVAGIKGVAVKTAVKYIRGELKKTSVVYKRIIERQDIYERNVPLVFLPHAKTKPVKIKKNRLKFGALKRMFREYELHSQLEPKTLKKWRVMFRGTLSVKEQKKNRLR